MPYCVGTKNGFVVTWQIETNFHLGCDGSVPYCIPAGAAALAVTVAVCVSVCVTPAGAEGTEDIPAKYPPAAPTTRPPTTPSAVLRVILLDFELSLIVSPQRDGFQVYIKNFPHVQYIPILVDAELNNPIEEPRRFGVCVGSSLSIAIGAS
jgi:hypothetical protein